MATTPTKNELEVFPEFAGSGVPTSERGLTISGPSTQDLAQKPSQRDALQALLAFSALHDQIRRRKALAAQHSGFDARTPATLTTPTTEFDPAEQFVLDEVLQLVAERAVAITGADGLAIALAENNEIVLRAAAGTVRPDVGARIDRDSAFSGACFRTARIVICDDTEVDKRVNLQACRKLGARSMVAVPLCGRRRVIGVLEAFSSWPFAFNESDVRNLSLLAELVLGALKPEDEDRFAESAQVAGKKLEAPAPPAIAQATIVQARVAPANVTPPRPAAAAPVAPAKTASVVPPAADVPPRPAAGVAPQVAPSKPLAPPPSVAPLKIVPTVPPAIAVAPKSAPVEPAAPIATPAKTEEVKAAAAPSAKVLDKAATESNKTPEIKAPEIKAPEIEPAAKNALEPTLTFGQLEPESGSRRAGVLVLLVCIVIAAAIAGGTWWKVKTAQLGSLIVHSDATRPEEIKPKPTTTDTTKDASGAATAPAASPFVVAQASANTAPDANEPMASPATPQELAKFPRVTGIRHWSSADSSTVVLDLEDQVQYEEHQIANPDRFYYDLRDTQLAPELAGKSIEVGDALLNRIRVAQPVAGMTRVVLETKGGASLPHPGVSLEPNPYRLVIRLRKPGADDKGAVNLFPNAPEPKKVAIIVPPPTKEDLQLRAHVPKMRIVVDAGHGGWDLGTVGRRGLLEKDLVLEIAERLGKLLQTRLGVDVIYTRQDDNYVTLDERAEIANQAQADLFISVHANYSDLPSARGVETYYTNFFSAPGSKDDAAKDASVKNASAPASAGGGAKIAPTLTLSPAELHERVEQSRRLATSVQHSLYGTLSAQNPGLRDRGIKEAGFVVLTESAMPGILAEVSFVSSPTDEQKLESDRYREQIAEALYKGIARYAASSRGVKVASKQSPVASGQ